MKEKKNIYSEADIQVFEGTEAIRKRPGMYIGGVGAEAYHHLFREIVNNSIDEYLAKTDLENESFIIEVFIDKDRKGVRIKDRGRGIPFGPCKKIKKNSTLETILTVTHSGGKFDSDVYKYSGGLHGVGITVVNALSSICEVISRRGDEKARILFKQGKVSEKIKIETAKRSKTGTEVYFKPDIEIFQGVEGFDERKIVEDLKRLACLNPRLRIEITNSKGKKEILEFTDGMGILLNGEIDKQVSEIVLENNVSIEAKSEDFEVNFCFNYTHSQKNNILSFTNNIHNSEF